MTQTHCILIGAPVDCGKRRRGCLMGPDAYRTAGIAEAITALGHTVEDIGNLSPEPVDCRGLAPIRACMRWPRTSAGPTR